MKRRESDEDPLGDLPQHLRAFDPAWQQVAAQGPDGFAEAIDAHMRWGAERRAWQQEHGFRGTPLDWFLLDLETRRQLQKATAAWLPDHGSRQLQNDSNPSSRRLPTEPYRKDNPA